MVNRVVNIVNGVGVENDTYTLAPEDVVELGVGEEEFALLGKGTLLGKRDLTLEDVLGDIISDSESEYNSADDGQELPYVSTSTTKRRRLEEGEELHAWERGEKLIELVGKDEEVWASFLGGVRKDLQALGAAPTDIPQLLLKLEVNEGRCTQIAKHIIRAVKGPIKRTYSGKAARIRVEKAQKKLISDKIGGYTAVIVDLQEKLSVGMLPDLSQFQSVADDLDWL